jgi:hypothetical protein
MDFGQKMLFDSLLHLNLKTLSFKHSYFQHMTKDGIYYIFPMIFDLFQKLSQSNNSN